MSKFVIVKFAHVAGRMSPCYASGVWSEDQSLDTLIRQLKADIVTAEPRAYVVEEVQLYDNELPDASTMPSKFERALSDTQAMMAQIAEIDSLIADESTIGEAMGKLRQARDDLSKAVATLARHTSQLAG